MITREQLIEYGYTPQLCKIGELFFAPLEPFFCSLKNGVVDLRLSSDDMHTFKTVSTMDELREAECAYYEIKISEHKFQIESLEKIIASKKTNREYRYNVSVKLTPKGLSVIRKGKDTYDIVITDKKELTIDDLKQKIKIFLSDGLYDPASLTFTLED